MLSATATREVEQDTLVGVVSVRVDAATAAAAQAEVNRKMTAAIAKARAVASVRAATGGYRVYQDYDKDGHPRRWIAEQDLRLTTREAGPLLELVGALQADGLNVNGLTYQLGDEARRTVEDELTVEAIQTLRNRAERVATSMAMRVLAIDDPAGRRRAGRAADPADVPGDGRRSDAGPAAGGAARPGDRQRQRAGGAEPGPALTPGHGGKLPDRHQPRRPGRRACATGGTGHAKTMRRRASRGDPSEARGRAVDHPPRLTTIIDIAAQISTSRLSNAPLARSFAT